VWAELEWSKQEARERLENQKREEDLNRRLHDLQTLNDLLQRHQQEVWLRVLAYSLVLALDCNISLIVGVCNPLHHYDILIELEGFSDKFSVP